MKVGDLVKVKDEHWSNKGQVGVIVEEVFAESKTNKGKAFRVLFPGGIIRPKLTKQLELINESSSI